MPRPERLNPAALDAWTNGSNTVDKVRSSNPHAVIGDRQFHEVLEPACVQAHRRGVRAEPGRVVDEVGDDLDEWQAVGAHRGVEGVPGLVDALAPS